MAKALIENVDDVSGKLAFADLENTVQTDGWAKSFRAIRSFMTSVAPP